MTFQTIPTIEEARENQVARLLWSASKKMALYQSATGEFSANDLFSGAITVDCPSEIIENCKILGIGVFVERADYSGFDKL